MTDTRELDELVATARYHGATVTVEYDKEAQATEGRRVYESIQVSGMRGVGPFAMSPLSAAETLRAANHRALHNLTPRNRPIYPWSK
jgi:hypothetical protein